MDDYIALGNKLVIYGHLGIEERSDLLGTTDLNVAQATRMTTMYTCAAQT